jgi:hypothetical protein
MIKIGEVALCSRGMRGFTLSQEVVGATAGKGAGDAVTAPGGFRVVRDCRAVAAAGAGVLRQMPGIPRQPGAGVRAGRFQPGQDCR